MSTADEAGGLQQFSLRTEGLRLGYTGCKFLVSMFVKALVVMVKYGIFVSKVYDTLCILQNTPVRLQIITAHSYNLNRNGCTFRLDNPHEVQPPLH